MGQNWLEHVSPYPRKVSSLRESRDPRRLFVKSIMFFFVLMLSIDDRSASFSKVLGILDSLIEEINAKKNRIDLTNS
jgi:hypothetical protein